MEFRVNITSKGTGAAEERRLTLEGKAIVGRGAESALVLDSKAVSREHFGLEAQGDEVVLTDLSANGTSINGTPLRKGTRQALKPGDVIGVPGFDLRIEPATADSAVVPPGAQEPAAAKGSLASTVRGFIGSFTRMERLLAMLSLASLGLVGVYWAS